MWGVPRGEIVEGEKCFYIEYEKAFSPHKFDYVKENPVWGPVSVRARGAGELRERADLRGAVKRSDSCPPCQVMRPGRCGMSRRGSHGCEGRDKISGCNIFSVEVQFLKLDLISMAMVE